MPNRLKGLWAGLLALIGLSLMLAWLDAGGFSNYEAEFLGAKALQALNGLEPRYRAIVSIFPPLLVYGTFFLGSVVTLQVLLGSILIGLLTRQLGNLSVSIWQWIWIALIVFNPAFGLMLLRSPAGIVVTIFMIVQMALLWKLAKEKVSPSLPATLLLVLLGLGLAPLMLVRYESWLLLSAIALILGMLFPQESWDYKFTAILVVLFMSLVLIGTWLYMNWIFTGDAYYFLNSHYSGMRLAQTKIFLQQENFWGSWLYSFTWIIKVVPVYTLISGWVIWQDRRWLVATLILLLPVILLVAALWQGTFMPEISRFGIFLGILPLLLQQFPLVKWQRFTFTGALVVNLLICVNLLQQNQFVPEETILWRQITQQSLPAALSVQQWHQQKQAQREIASVLFEKLVPGQKVLMDDAVNFPIIYLVNDASYFILPYQNEFFLALQQPDLMTDFILIPGPETRSQEQDRIVSYWPQLAETTLPGFQEVFGTPHYKLLQRLSP